MFLFICNFLKSWFNHHLVLIIVNYLLPKYVLNSSELKTMSVNEAHFFLPHIIIIYFIRWLNTQSRSLVQYNAAHTHPRELYTRDH